VTATAPSFSQIKAQVAAIRRKIPNANVIGIHSPSRWTGESAARDNGNEYAIQQCDSPLSFRIALRKEFNEATTKVLITDLVEQDLSDDILLRLAKRRLFQIDSWQIVRSLFEAHAVDPRLSKHSWIAEALLENIPSQGYPAARGGFLDAESVWPILLEGSIGFASDSPDLISLLKWSLELDNTQRFRQCSSEFRRGAIEWLSEKAGPVATVVLHCIEHLELSDAVPIGLAAGVIYHPSATGKLEKATGKLEERYLGGASPDSKPMSRWSAAATEVIRDIRQTDPKTYRQKIYRADEILQEVQADSLAHLSDTSPLGFDQRLAQIGDHLEELIAGNVGDDFKHLSELRKSLKEHDQSSREKRRIERVEMSHRLLRWMSTAGNEQPSSLPEAAAGYLHEGGFVDWARLSLRSGDPVQKLSESYSHLFDRVTQIREKQSEVFAKLLTDWTVNGSVSDDIIPVECILDEIVAPLAGEGLVLVIVVDGMSVAVCQELLPDIMRHEWIAISEPGRNFNRPAIATIPSVTEFSRTSLLSGRLCSGTQQNERSAFSQHAALVSTSRSGSPPVLFHKASLEEQKDSLLAAEVRREIASTHRRVVGVVVNAVDDHLLKGEQIDTRWSRDEIKVLSALTHEARIARRRVVIVSDHGHILDCQAKGRLNKEDDAGGERWRTDQGEVAEDELRAEGSRVLTDGHKFIAPWSERVRYGIKKNGYHGGLTPQEMIVPVVVLASTEDFPKGWSEQPVVSPLWWDEPSEDAQNDKKPVLNLKPMESKPADTLFDMTQFEKSEVKGDSAVLTTQESPPWVTRLLACSVFEDQKRLGGRGVPADELFAKLLTALDERGGKLTSVALARTLAYPPIRLPGLLAKAERVLNVDGYDVLRRDDASDTIELNRSLLLKQFDLVE